MVSCSQEELVKPDNVQSLPEQSATHVSLREALKKADRILDKIGEPATRSAARTVKSVEYIGGSGTRADGDDPLYYVVNYDNNEGFAVLGADSRLDGVYAISDKGHLDMNDTTENLGLNIFFRSLPDRANLPINPKDSMNTGTEPWVDRLDITIDLSYKYEPVLTSAVSKWHQQYPFNIFCYTVNGEEALVGCTAVAIGQVMSYYEHPQHYGQYSFDCDQIKSIKSNGFYDIVFEFNVRSSGLARLLRELGNSDNLNMDYGTEASGAKILTTHKRTFKSFGYKEPENFKSFSPNEIEKWLSKSKPVLIVGTNQDYVGHAWVIDGLYCDWFQHTGIDNQVDYFGEGTLFHMVWGWGGNCNGYFKYGPTLQVCNKFKDESDPQSWDSDWDSWIKYYNLQYCGNIEPN